MYRLNTSISTAALPSVTIAFAVAVACTFSQLPGFALSRSFAAEANPLPQAELEAVTSAITVIQTWLNDANASYSVEVNNLREAERRINEFSSNIAAVRNELTRTLAVQDKLKLEITALEAVKSENNELLRSLLRAAYMNGDQSLLKLLLNQQDLSKNARMLHYYSVYSTAQIAALQQFETTIVAIANTNIELQAGIDELSRQQIELESQLAALERGKQIRQLALSELQASISARNAELEQMQIDQQQLQQLIEEIDRAIENIPAATATAPFASRRGQLSLPLAGTIVQNFGARYGEGNLARRGISIAAPEGSPAQAVHAGRVVFADWLRGAGLLVIVDHGAGYMSLYGNNQALAKTASEQVVSGDVIATSSNPGENNDYAPFFEIRYHGMPQDPADWIMPR